MAIAIPTVMSVTKYAAALKRNYEVPKINSNVCSNKVFRAAGIGRYM